MVKTLKQTLVNILVGTGNEQVTLPFYHVTVSGEIS